MFCEKQNFLQTVEPTLHDLVELGRKQETYSVLQAQDTYRSAIERSLQDDEEFDAVIQV